MTNGALIISPAGIMYRLDVNIITRNSTGFVHGSKVLRYLHNTHKKVNLLQKSRSKMKTDFSGPKCLPRGSLSER